MCDPMTLAIAGTAVAVAGTAVTGYMSYNQSKYQQKVAKANQMRENQRIASAMDTGAIEQRNLARKYAALRGQQTASMAANGIDVGFGSAADTLGDTAQYYKEDAEATNRNTMNEIKGIDMNAANYGSQAKAAGMAATGAAISTAFDIGSTVLGGLRQTGKISADRKAGGSGWG